MMKVVDLKEEEDLIKQYVDLRNSYADLLLTSPVNVPETKKWLKKNEIEIRGVVEDGALLGVAILYLNRSGEIAFFTKYKNKGIGGRLLYIIKEVAARRYLKSVWAWVLNDNFIAQRVFKKNGFVKEGISEREYNNKIFSGIIFKKDL
jgi:RimJ/RimL family protein N-acetyltransferase